MILLMMFSAVAFAQDREAVDQRIERIIEQYMNTKDALVHNLDERSAAWAERLETTLATTPNDIFEEDDLPVWQDYQHGMLEASGRIVDAEAIEEQRSALAALSSEMKELLEYFGTSGESLFIFSCSDYGEDEVIWINNSEQLANPYFGPENLASGEMIGEL